jgi:hypothetical protein
VPVVFYLLLGSSLTSGFLGVLLAGVLVVAGIVSLAGVCLCGRAPGEAHALRWVVLLFVFLGAALASGLMIQVGLPEGLLIPALVVMLCFLVLAHFSTILLLRTLARSRGEKQLGTSFLYFFGTVLSLDILGSTLLLGAQVSAQNPYEAEFFGLFGGCGAWGVAIFSLVLLAWWVRLLWQLREALPWPPSGGLGPGLPGRDKQ